MKPLSIFRLMALTAIGFALTADANTLDPILTYKIRQLAPGSPNMGLGLISAAGLVVAIFTQPIVGVFSDRAQSPLGRRLPFMVAGVAGIVVCLYLIAFAPAVAVALAGVLLLQLASNTVQGPWQALIPDQVPEAQRGRAAGFKAFFDIVAMMAGSLSAAALLGRSDAWGHTAAVAAVTVPAILFLITLAITLAWARERMDRATPMPRQPVKDALRHTFSIDFGAHPEFRWWFANRLLVWTAFIALGAFMINYMTDVIFVDPHLSALQRQAAAQRYFGTVKIIIGAALAVVALPSGWLTDRIGRRPLMFSSSLVAGAGTILILLTRDLTLLSVAAGIVGLGVGIWVSASWALITDIVPGDEAARYMGIANIATAGGSALARFLGGAMIDPVNRLAGTHSAGYLALYGLAAALFLVSALAILPLGSRRTSSPAPGMQPQALPLSADGH